MTTRDVLVSAMRGRLIDRGWPRLVALLIVTLSGGAAFGASVAVLRWGVDAMAIRYPLATVIGYLTFIILIRVWIALQREENLDADPVDVVDAIQIVGDALPAAGSGPPDSSWFDGAFDLEEAWFVVVAVACAIGGLIAIAYVVYIAPALLVEVALDAALVSTVYRRLRREDAGWWAASVLRRTWLPATVLVIFTGVAGWALQQIAPDARSIGGVVQELTS